jgi:hypothetical protein
LANILFRCRSRHQRRPGSRESAFCILVD